MKTLKKVNYKAIAEVLIQLIIGTAIYAFSIDAFYHPAKLLGGGVTGFAQILDYSLGISTSLSIVLINIPLFILGMILVDKAFALYSLAGMLILSFFLNIFSGISIPFSSDLTAVTVGGIINGLGLGLVYRSGASLGGTDIISKILQKYISGNMAFTGMAFNVLVVGTSAVIYGLDQAVLTVCAMFISTEVNNYLIDGVDHRRAVNVVTKHPDEMAQAIYLAVNRGCTVLKGYGAHTHEEYDMLYCVFAKRQLAKIKRTIKAVDPNAFFTISRVTGVYGYGRDFFSVKKDIQ